MPCLTLSGLFTELNDLMKINGKNAASGTIVVKSTDTAAIDTPMGELNLRFNPSANNAINFDAATNTIVFDGFTSPQGMAGDKDVTVDGKPKFLISFVVYTIGTLPKVIRLVHYTVSDV